MCGQILRGITIGAGYFSRIQLDAWRKVDGATIVGLVDISMDNLMSVAAEFDIPYIATELERAIEDLHPDFIDICTPPSAHGHYVKLAADRNIPIICQKPIASTLDESEEIVNYCMARNARLMIHENWRWQPWYQEMKRLIDAGVLGRVLHVDVTMRPGDGWGESPYPDQPYFKLMDRFLLLETGIHYFDTLQFLFGRIARIYCRQRTINSLVKGEDYIIVVMEFEQGFMAIYDANRVAHTSEVRCTTYGWMRIEGESGNMRLDKDGRLFITPRGGEEYEHSFQVPKGWKGGCVIATQQHFVDSILRGEKFATDGNDYLNIESIVESCYKSAVEGIPVTI